MKFDLIMLDHLSAHFCFSAFFTIFNYAFMFVYLYRTLPFTFNFIPFISVVKSIIRKFPPQPPKYYWQYILRFIEKITIATNPKILNESCIISNSSLNKDISII